jgi:acyl-coenzyme A synthetase/AMP-(fatty) acid ligase
MTNTAPLINGELDDPLAWLFKPLLGLDFGGESRVITRAEFLQHVSRLAKLLPDQQHAITLCDNRYLFLVSAWAVIVRKQSNLLPPNKNTITQTKLADRYDDCYAIHDGAAELANDLLSFDVSTLSWNLEAQDNALNISIPELAFKHPAIISFTSGSTGESMPN